MRTATNKDLFTPFSLWLQEYVRKDISITNLDFILEDYKSKKIMLLEEKQSGGKLHNAQLLTFDVIDYIMTKAAEKADYEYWGFFLLQFPSGATMPGPGMTLNDKIITTEQLQQHLNFVKPFTNGREMPWMAKTRK